MGGRRVAGQAARWEAAASEAAASQGKHRLLPVPTSFWQKAAVLALLHLHACRCDALRLDGACLRHA